MKQKTESAPAPVPVRYYRYSRLRWRVLVHLIDGIGAAMMFLLKLFRRPRPVHKVRRILIVQLDHLGDAVLTTAMLPEIRQNWPEAQIDVLASNANAEVFMACPHVCKVQVAERNWFERRSGCWAMLTAAWRLGSQMKAEKYDLAFDVRGDILSIFLLVLAGIPQRVGWAMGGGGFWLTNRAEWVPGRHEVLSRMELLRAIGIEPPPKNGIKLHLAVSRKDRQSVDQHLSRLWTPYQWLQACLRSGYPDADLTSLVAPLVVIHPGAGIQAKRWPVSYWRRLVTILRDAGFFVAIIGAEEDRPFAGMIRNQLGVVDLTGQLPLTETLALLERSGLFIGVDSGPAHLAAAVNARSVVLFSGTNRAAQWRPWSDKILGLRHRVGCSPCHQKLCPLSEHVCMQGMVPEQVARKALLWWQKGQKDRNRISDQINIITDAA